DFLNGGGTLENVAAQLVASDEYFLTKGGGTNAGFLNALFLDALNRPIDAPSQAIALDRLASGTSRLQIAQFVFASAEYRFNLVQSYYVTYLKRAGDPVGLDTFVAALGADVRDEALVGVFVASDEYLGPVGGDVNLTADDVGTLLQRAAA